MAIRCPKCFSENTYVYVTRSKYYNDIAKEFDTSDLPKDVLDMDHVLRRHKCRSCGITFPTVEIYYKQIDIDDYKRNVAEGLKSISDLNSQKLQSV